MIKPELLSEEITAVLLIKGIARARIDSETKKKAMRAIVRILADGRLNTLYRDEVDINMAFTWGATPEGWSFWSEVNTKVGYCRIDLLEA